MEWAAVEALMIIAGVIGAFTRICIQFVRDREVPEVGFSLILELFIGAVCGYVAFMIADLSGAERGLEWLAFTLGYMGTDALENLVGAKWHEIIEKT